MKALTYVCLLDGILYPVQAIQAAWSTAPLDNAFQITIPGGVETHQILPSTHAHLWLLEDSRTYFRRTISRIDRDNLNGEALWFDESLKTIGQPSPVMLGRPSELMPSTLVDLLPHEGWMYRGGGEVIRSLHSKSPQSANSTTLVVGGYSHLLTRIKAIQLVRGAGAITDAERRWMGQHGDIFPGKGRKAFANGVLDLLTKNDNNLSLGVRQLMNHYALNTNAMWRTRFPMARVPNQIIGLDDDTSASRLLKGKDFRKVLQEILTGQQVLSLDQVSTLLMQIIGYQLVPVPSPAYFPLAPTSKMIQTGTREISPERVEQYTSGPGVEVLLPEREIVVYEGGPPTMAGSITWGTSDPSKGEWISQRRVAGVPIARKNVTRSFLTGGKLRGTLSRNPDKTVTIRFNVPAGWTGGPATYNHTLSWNVVCRAFPRAEDGTDIPPEDTQPNQFEYNAEGYTDFPMEALSYTSFSVGILLDDLTWVGRKIRAAVRLLPGGPRTRTIPAVTEPIMTPEDGDLLPNWVSRLNTYLILPKLWWALFPASNIVLPEQVVSWERTGQTMDRLTRLVAKIPPGRSGSRTTFVDKFPAPTEADLNKALSETEDSETPKKILPYEYIGGPLADVWYVDTLARAMRSDEWAGYMKSRVTAEFWDRRLASSQAELSMELDPSIVPGTTMLVILSGNTQYQGISPEQRALLQRLAALRALKKRLRKCRRSKPPANRLLRHLTAVWNQRKGHAYAVAQGYTETPPSTSGSSGTMNLDAFTELHANIRRKMTSVGGSIGEFWVACGGRKHAGVYPYSTSPTYWSYIIALECLGHTEESIQEEGVSLDAFRAFFSAGTTIKYDEALLLKLISLLRDDGSKIAEIDRCNAAVSRDMDRVDQAIEDTQRLLRAGGASGGDADAYIGYVTAVRETVSGEGMVERMSVTLSHVRKVGDDLDYDGLVGDDLENVVAFGENGYLDERYRRSAIGEKVYLPLYGCKSGLEIPGVTERLTTPASTESADAPLPIDASDIIADFEHPSICPGDCTDGESTLGEGITEFDVASAIIDIYRDLQSELGESSQVLARFKEWKSRLYMNCAEAYIGSQVAWTSDETSPAVQEGFAKMFESVYTAGEKPIQGFFATSFSGLDPSEAAFERLRPRKLGGEKEDPKLTDDEKALLRDRADRVVGALAALEMKTYE